MVCEPLPREPALGAQPPASQDPGTAITWNDLEDAVRRLLEYLGEDPDREGLRDTPRRVLAYLREATEGLRQDPATLLATTFASDDYDQVVLCRNIRFDSLCEHHLLPFRGTATVAYLPGDSGRVLGLSKIPRLVQCFARRLQIQERLTHQIAHALQDHLTPRGVGVVLTAHHLCTSCRGVKQPDLEMVTSCLLGDFRTSPGLRAELLNLR